MLLFCRLYSWTGSNSWSEATFRQLFKNWLLVMWISTSPVLFTTMDSVFCKFALGLVSYCFCIIRTPCHAKNWCPGHIVLQGTTKMCNTGRKDTMAWSSWLAGQHIGLQIQWPTLNSSWMRQDEGLLCFSVLLRKHLYRLVRACLAFMCMDHRIHKFSSLWCRTILQCNFWCLLCYCDVCQYATV